MERYRRLSDLFDQVLSLSNMIMFELEREGKDEDLKSLLKRKDATGRSIAEITQEIASSGVDVDFQSNLRTLAEVKPILRQIEKQASLLEVVEKRIQTLVKQRDKS